MMTIVKQRAVRIIDTHLHLWDPALLQYTWLSGPLLRRFGPEHLAAATAGAPPVHRREFVFVQAGAEPSLAEVDWVTENAEAAGVVAIVAHAAVEGGDEVRAELELLRQRPLVTGVRRLLQSEPQGFARRPDFLQGARALVDAGLTFDACVTSTQLPDVTYLATHVADLSVVLDHLGKPPVGTPAAPLLPSDSAWLDDLRELARRPNVICKISGLPAESPSGWSAAQFTPFLDAALDAFGPDRLVLGGDWPVSTPYADWFGYLETWLARLSPDEADAIRWRNARAVYRTASA